MNNTQGENNLVNIIALVVVNPAVHYYDLFALNLTENQRAVVTSNGRYGKALNLAVWNFGNDFEFVGVIAQAAAQYQRDVGHKICLFANLLNAVFQARVVVVRVKLNLNILPFAVIGRGLLAARGLLDV